MLKKIQLEVDTAWTIQFKRRNVDTAWGPSISFRTISNTTPPLKPSKPTLAPYLGQIIVRWNGFAADGSAYLPDFNRCEVHVSSTSGFTPSSSTLKDQFSHAGAPQETVISSLTYDTTYYVKFVVVNNSKTPSTPSDQEFAKPTRVSGIDIADGSINASKVNLSSRDLGESINYYQPSAPSSTVNPGNAPRYNDLWFDTDDGYKNYRYFDPTLTQNAGESDIAYAARQNASTNRQWLETPLGQSVPGARIFWQVDAPVQANYPGGFKQGDTWYDSDGDNKLYIWVPGSGWVAQQFGASAFAAGSITAGKIATGAITADKMAANSITAQNAAIANAAIDDAKIANVSAGKLTAGIITTDILLSGNIRTSTTGSRVEISQRGIYQYDSSNSIVSFFNNISGTAYIRGEVRATLFRSAGYQTSGAGYIEIGNTGANDPTDELRMFYGGYSTSIRNPSDTPGAIRFSMTNPAVGTVELYSNKLNIPNGFSFVNKSFNTSIVSSGNGWLIKGSNSGLNLYTSDTNNLFLGNTTGTGAGLKLLGGVSQIQARNSADNAYGTFIATNFQTTSSPELKENIAEINLDALGMVDDIGFHAWDWIGDESNQSGLGFLLTELPAMFTPEGDENSFSLSTMAAFQMQAIKQLKKQNEELLARLEALERATLTSTEGEANGSN